MARGSTETPKVSKRFDSTIQEAVHEGLLVVGEIVRQAIYRHIEMKYQVKPGEIHMRLEAFDKALTGIFGAGAKIVEKLIAKRLYSKLGLSFVENENWTLVEYVRDAKKHMEGSQRMKKNEILEFVKHMKAKDHVITFYSKPEDKHSVLFTYLKAGLDAGEAAAYIASEEPPSQIRQAMRRFGIDVDRFEKSSALHVIDYKKWYIIDGKFSVPKTMELWKKLYDESMAKGFKGLRVNRRDGMLLQSRHGQGTH